MKRDIIVIDEDKCVGCGACVPSCAEGALQVIDGKVRLISDLYCDGLGVCVGHCPFDAMKIEQKEAAPYNERSVMEDNIIPAGENTIIAHLEHLLKHNAKDLYQEAIQILEEKGIENPLKEKDNSSEKGEEKMSGCPGSKMMEFNKEVNSQMGDTSSQLQQWPVQLHLVSPMAPYFANSDLLLAADCTAFAMGDFHSKLKGKSLAIACPKLDQGMDLYLDKLVEMIDNNNVNTITCMIMEVPCCGGLLGIAKEAVSRANRKVPLKALTISLQGEVLDEKWV